MQGSPSHQGNSSPYFGNSSNSRYRTRNIYPQSPNRQSRYRSPLSSNNNSNSSNSADFIYQGRNKQQWATLQSKIRTRLATQNILYLEDELEMARRTTPPAPAVTLHAPAHYIESAAERDDRIRQQKLNDDDFKKRDTKFDE